MSRPFLSFDPFFISVDIILFFSFFIFFAFPFKFLKNQLRIVIQGTEKTILNLFPKPPFLLRGLWGFLFLLFLFFSFFNFLRLIIYIFTPTAHLIITFSIGILIWISTFLIQRVYFFFRKIEHFSPLGTPLWLLPLIVIIEVIRQLIRPITLRVRLAANLTAGHLILSLLASLSLIQRIFLQIPLILLEILVALVQPFVFCILLFLYFSER